MKQLSIFLMFFGFGMTYAEARVSCKQFGSWENAQAYLKAKKQGYKSLDKDNDGFACDGLKAAEATQRARIRIYQNGDAYAVGSIYGSKNICEKEREKLQRKNTDTDFTYQCEIL